MTRLQGIRLQGGFAEAYVNVVCRAAGYICTKPIEDTGHKVDFYVTGAGAGDTPRDPRLEIQVKSTYVARNQEGESHFSFDVDLYDWARKPTPMLYVPRLVVLVQVPETPTDWMNQSDAQLLVKHCAYWTKLTGRGALPEGQQSITIPFVCGQKFDVVQLQSIMDQIAAGTW